MQTTATDTRLQSIQDCRRKIAEANKEREGLQGTEKAAITRRINKIKRQLVDLSHLSIFDVIAEVRGGVRLLAGKIKLRAKGRKGSLV